MVSLVSTDVAMRHAWPFYSLRHANDNHQLPQLVPAKAMKYRLHSTMALTPWSSAAETAEIALSLAAREVLLNHVDMHLFVSSPHSAHLYRISLLVKCQRF